MPLDRFTIIQQPKGRFHSESGLFYFLLFHPIGIFTMPKKSTWETVADLAVVGTYLYSRMNQDFLSSYYHEFKEPALTHRRFKHRDIVPLIQKLPFPNQLIGESTEGRSIHQVTIGNGPKKILLWSQMHGDEPTATMALFDLFRFFASSNPIFAELRTLLTTELTLYFVPMLNPDGAERYIRRTALEIDMNRDALALQCPESRLLKKLQQELQPLFAFNLHDQGTRYSAGASGKQATLSFLATAYNPAREWNEVRTRSRQVISGMNTYLQKLIPGHIGRYSDEFEPRAFGDNIQKWGSSLILIESGGYKDDREKQFIRQLNFLTLLEGLRLIAKDEYSDYTLADYESIPQNGRALFDFILRDIQFTYRGKTLKKDIAININETFKSTPPYYGLYGSVEEVGDLSTFFGIKELASQNLSFRSLNEYPQWAKKVKSIPKGSQLLGKQANFALVQGNTLKYVVINGQMESV